MAWMLIRRDGAGSDGSLLCFAVSALGPGLLTTRAWKTPPTTLLEPGTGETSMGAAAWCAVCLMSMVVNAAVAHERVPKYDHVSG